jgi:hypothetical protein
VIALTGFGIIYPLPPKGTPLERVDNPSFTFNWGVVSSDAQGSYDSVVNRLNQAKLTELAVELLEGLRLGDEYAVREQSEFARHMQLLTQYSNSSMIDTRWVEVLLTFLPPFVFDEELNTLIDEQELNSSIDQYLRRGFGAPLTALYMLTLRSGYWQNQLDLYYRDSGLVYRPIACKYSFAQILGDPFTSPSTTTWEPIDRTDYFLTRESLVYSYLVEPDNVADDTIRAVTAAMLLLANIAGRHLGGRLKKYLDEYHSWNNEWT